MIKKILPKFLWGVAILLLLVGLAYPAILRFRAESRNASCKNNLKNIGLLMKMYAEDCDDPVVVDSFKILFDAGVTNNGNIFICPASGKQPGRWADVGQWTDYVILPLPDFKSKVSAQFVRCKHSHHDGTNVLYTDGHIEWLNSKYVGKTP